MAPAQETSHQEWSLLRIYIDMSKASMHISLINKTKSKDASPHILPFVELIHRSIARNYPRRSRNNTAKSSTNLRAYKWWPRFHSWGIRATRGKSKQSSRGLVACPIHWLVILVPSIYQNLSTTATKAQTSTHSQWQTPMNRFQKTQQRGASRYRSTTQSTRISWWHLTSFRMMVWMMKKTTPNTSTMITTIPPASTTPKKTWTKAKTCNKLKSKTQRDSMNNHSITWTRSWESILSRTSWNCRMLSIGHYLINK